MKKRGTLFRRLLLLQVMTILVLAVVVGASFMRFSGPAFTRVRADEVVSKVQAVATYFQQYMQGQLSYKDMQSAISASGTLNNSELQIYARSGDLVIFSLEKPMDFYFRADSPEMQGITLPVALEAITTGQSTTRTMREQTRGTDYMVVAVPLMDGDKISGAVVLTSSMRVVQSPLDRLYILLGFSCLIAFFVMLVPLYYFLKRMVKPLQQMNAVALSMAQGNFSLRADENMKGEVGELAHSVNHLATQLGSTLEALMLERNRLQLTIDGLAEGILALDESGALLHTNPVLYDFLNIPANEQHLFEAMEEIEGSLLLEIKAVAQTGQPLTRNVTINGAVLHIIATPIYDEAKTCRGVVALFHDITESERLEQTRRDYVANVSHELRTPLSAVRGLTEALNDGLIKTPQDRSRYYGYILRECMRLGRLIEDLLELSRLQGGKVALKKTTVDLAQLLGDIRMRYATLSYDLGIQFEVKSEQCPPVYSNADRIEQVLVILLDNAFKFTEEGGIVKVFTSFDDNKVSVHVSDNGAGIGREDLPHVFERFYKAEKSHSGSGTGLGLSIAKEVLTLMGEAIAVTSEIGKGTTFHFTLQRADNI